MELNDYQERAMTTCMESSNNFAYMMLNLVGEVGEFASKVAKAIRKKCAVVHNNKLYIHTELPKGIEEMCKSDFEKAMAEVDDSDKEFVEELKKEAGDCLWQLAGLCKVMGWTLEEVAQQNLDKLSSRKERNKIDGDGDNR